MLKDYEGLQTIKMVHKEQAFSITKGTKTLTEPFVETVFFCPPLLLVVLMGAKKWQFLPAELGGPSFTRVPQGLWVGWGPCGPGCFFFLLLDMVSLNSRYKCTLSLAQSSI